MRKTTKKKRTHRNEHIWNTLSTSISRMLLMRAHLFAYRTQSLNSSDKLSSTYIYIIFEMYDVRTIVYTYNGFKNKNEKALSATVFRFEVLFVFISFCRMHHMLLQWTSFFLCILGFISFNIFCIHLDDITFFPSSEYNICSHISYLFLMIDSVKKNMQNSHIFRCKIRNHSIF